MLAGLRFGFASTLLGAVVVGIVAGLLVNGWIGVGGGVVGAVIGAVSAAAIVRGADRRGATIGGTAFLLVGAAVVVGLLALDPGGRLRRGDRPTRRRRPARAQRPREVRRAALAREVSPRQPLILVVIDGLTPSMLEGAIGSGETPTLAALAARGDYGRATSVFPSLTPVCLSSIATGRTATSTRFRISSGTTAASGASSSTAARSGPCAPRGSARRCGTRSST